MRPNILWYCTDQQRWDTISALGQKHIATPMLDELCRGGVAFERAYTVSPTCTPSRASFLTGRYPASHHVYRNGNSYFPAHEKLVTRILADAGYDCGLVGKLHLSSGRNGERRVDDGYRVFHWSLNTRAEYGRGAYGDWLKEKGIDPTTLYASQKQFCAPGVPAALHQTTWASDMAIRFITEKRNGPWMLSVNPFDPHVPFDAPPEYLTRVDKNSLPLPLFRKEDVERQRAFAHIDQQSKKATDHTLPQTGNTRSWPPEAYDAREVKAHYYAMIMSIDDQLRRIIDTLRETGQLENTLIIFMSDHGDLLGDHGLILKGCRFFDGLVRVPMIFYWQGVLQQNLRSQALVETIDIAPTILDIAGIPVPYDMQGKSLLPLMRGEKDPHTHKRFVTCEYKDSMGGPQFTDHSHGSMVFDGRYKSVMYHGHNIGELYDTKNDPGEFINLWDDKHARDLKLKALKVHIDAIMQTVSTGPQRSSTH
jgi:arylsulfatase